MTKVKEFIEGDSTSKIVHVQGAEGVGKSYFVDIVSEELPNFTYLSGRFNNSKPVDPLSGLKQLFQSQIQYRLSLQDSKNLHWLDSLKNRFSDNSYILCNLFPRLSELFELELSNEDDFSPNIIQNRVKAVYIDFIQFWCSLENGPFILHLDNLQWADPISLEIVSALAKSPFKNFVLILSDRGDNDDKAYQEFTLQIKSCTGYFNCQLHTLNNAELIQLFKTANIESNTDFNALAEYFLEATNGNLLLIKEQLSSFEKKGKLHFQKDEGHWQITINFSSDISNQNLSALLAQKISPLSKEEMKLLQSIACFGKNLNTTFISKILNVSEHKINALFQKFVQEDILIPLGNFQQSKTDVIRFTNYEFKHHYIQEWFKENSLAKLKANIHTRIANYFIKDSAIGIQERDIYQAVFHFNESIQVSHTKAKDKVIHAKLNLMAAEKAKTTAAFELARQYLKEAERFEVHKDWHKHYELASNWSLLAYQMFRYKDHIKYSNQIYTEAQKHLNKDDIYELELSKLIMDVQKGELKASLETGVQLLKKLGLKIYPSVAKLHLAIAYLRTRTLLKNKGKTEILKLPELKNKNIQNIFKVMFWMFRSTQYLNPELNGYLALKKLQLTLKYGIYGDSFSGLMAYGVIVGAGTNDLQTAYTYCKTGEEIANKFGNHSGEVEFGKAIYKAYKYPLKDTLSHYEIARLKLYEKGDFTAAAETTVNESLSYFSAGYNLKQVLDKVNENLDFCEQLDATDFYNFQLVFKSKILVLSGEPLPKGLEQKVQKIIKTTQYRFSPIVASIMDMFLSAIQNNWKEVWNTTVHIDKSTRYLSGLYFQTEYEFLKSLAATQLLKNVPNSQQRKFNKIIKKTLSNINKCSHAAKENYIHKKLILEGLIDLNSNNSTALLEAAIEKARSNGFGHYSAILYNSLYNITGEEKYQQLSNLLYNEWGVKS